MFCLTIPILTSVIAKPNSNKLFNRNRRPLVLSLRNALFFDVFLIWDHLTDFLRTLSCSKILQCYILKIVCFPVAVPKDEDCVTAWLFTPSLYVSCIVVPQQHNFSNMKFYIDNLPVSPKCSCHGSLLRPMSDYIPLRPYLSRHVNGLIYTTGLLTTLPEQYSYMCDLKRTLDATVL